MMNEKHEDIIGPYTCVAAENALNREDIRCPTCDATFAMSRQEWVRSKLLHEPFSCPSGHKLTWPYAEQAKAVADAARLFKDLEDCRKKSETAISLFRKEAEASEKDLRDSLSQALSFLKRAQDRAATAEKHAEQERSTRLCWQAESDHVRTFLERLLRQRAALRGHLNRIKRLQAAKKARS